MGAGDHPRARALHAGGSTRPSRRPPHRAGDEPWPLEPGMRRSAAPAANLLAHAVPLAQRPGAVAWRALLRLYLHSRAAPLRTDVSAGSRPISLVGVPRMATATRKTDLSPLEALVVGNTLGGFARRNTRGNAMARIQLL